MTDSIGLPALALFLIIFLWTPPHFWALACYRRDEYARAGLPMLPVSHGVPLTCLHILLYTVLLAAVSYLPATLGLSGGLRRPGQPAQPGLPARSLVLWRDYSDTRARHAFRYSLIYLTGLFAALFLDRLA
jgi:protoheme IX farnesyltransferase